MIDLHIHSSASDGTLDPAELVRRAGAVGLKAIALTDHDTVGGVPEAVAEGEKVGVEVVAGVEISIEFSPGTFHLIGLLVDPEDAPIRAALQRVLQGRSERNRAIARRLGEMGVSFRLEEAAQRAGGEVVGRPHFAAALVERGLARNVKDAFDRFLGKGSPAYVERYRLPLDEAIRLIHGAGGVTVLCHPFTLGLDAGDGLGGPCELFEFVRDLRDRGLDAIEAYYPEHSAFQERLFREIASELGLLVSGGSDFHGLTRKDQRIGLSGFARRVPYEVLTALRERAGRYGPDGSA